MRCLIASIVFGLLSLASASQSIAASHNGDWQLSSFDGAQPLGLQILEIRSGHVRLKGCGEFGGFIREDAGFDKIQREDLGMPACTDDVYREHTKLYRLFSIRQDRSHLVIEDGRDRAEFEFIQTIQMRSPQ